MKKFHLATLIILGFAAGKVSAQTVTWGTSYSDVPATFLADGSPDISSVLTWTLGYFQTPVGGAFTPTADNFDSWVTNWKPVADQVYHTDPDTGEYVALQSYAGTGGPPAVPAAIGQTMWIFAYNNTASIGTPSGQALLFTQNTTFPGIALSKDFDIQDTAGNAEDDNFTIVWGRVDRDWLGAGGIQSGSGVVSQAQSDSVESGVNSGYGTFEAQSATWPVPEASSSLLGLMGSALLLGRRRRK
ncbi:MAG: hypothetical protein V4726_24150 [Verrucomicrobiota bacterium]